jgi:hypothetical protein
MVSCQNVVWWWVMRLGLRKSGSYVKNGSGLGIVVFINDNHLSPLI